MIIRERFVLDTNVLISALIIRTSIAYRVLDYCICNGVLLFSTETFGEFGRVLLRPKFDRYFSDAEKRQILCRFADITDFKKISSDFKVCRDFTDDMFLNLAVDGDACCISTGDKDLLAISPFRKIPILTPAQFLYYFKGYDDYLTINEPHITYKSGVYENNKKV